MNTLFNLTYFSFLACGLASFLAVIYFLTQAPHLKGRLRLLVLLNILICAVSSGLHLYFFAQLQPLAAGAAGIDEMAAAIGNLPLIVRYGYWLATTLMLILMFPLLMGLERVGTGFALTLVLIDTGMIATGYLGEQATLAGGGATTMAFFWFSVSGLLWLAMTVSIFQALHRLPSDALIPAQRDALVYMFFFFLVGWAIFPAGFFYAIVFDSGVGVVLREFTVNIGDIVNKVIWGVLVVYAAREISRAMTTETQG
ncbi:hypothetical protein CCR95_06790 [Thiocystis minor]|uniref:bacteriorhodopsin n=1 Tax=Thiocystis minor TaxID=61597 RepID=UPI001912C3DA|nr:bacteriorhodopsin [Thiocystis minor]MBK5963797.1 hypothetical protein [Thiocystis minor]